MDKIDEFKSFVKDNNYLIDYVRDKKKTWQELYELYDMYGEDKNIWNNYLKDNNINDRHRNSFNELFDIAKNIDVDKLQNGITSLQKAISLFGDLFINNNSNDDNVYQPRPIYRRFDD